MEDKPKIIKGRVHDTGWPIDGYTLYFLQWDYDHGETWHLYEWEDESDSAVMETFYHSETAAGICLFDTMEEFRTAWKSGDWEAQGSFCLTKNQVETTEELQPKSESNKI